MKRPLLTPRLVWLAIGFASTALVVTSLILTVWLDLHPCPLCIFQRLLWIILAILALVAALSPMLLIGYLARGLAMLVATGGALIAGYQVWLQAQPVASLGCVGGPLKPVETLVFWLGERVPALFLATGLCGDVELMILGSSLAGWSLVCFVVSLVAGAWVLCNGCGSNSAHTT